MNAALLTAPREFAFDDIPPPALADGHVLIRPSRAGICGSDLSFHAGHRPPPFFPFVIGHEVVGRVTAVGAGVAEGTIGQRVVVEPNYPCGACRFCAAGRGNICPRKVSLGVTVPGCFADLVAVPSAFAWRVPDAISDADAATIEPLAVALHALRQSGTGAGNTVAVIGCGAIGLLMVHVAVAMGVRVLACDRLASKTSLAGALGADIAVLDAEDLAARWAAEQVDTVYECAGGASSVATAIASAPRGSRVVLLGLSVEPASFVPLRIVREGIRIEPSLIYDHPRDFADAIRLVGEGTLTPSKVVTEVFPFEHIATAFQEAGRGTAGKVHLHFD